MKMRFSDCLIRTPISVGEIIGGYYSRHHLYMNTKALHRSDRPKTPWHLPSNLDAVSESLWQTSRLSRALLTNNTLFPAFSKFLNPSALQFVEHHHRFTARPGISAMVDINHKRHWWSFAACRKCVSKDIAADGRPFWRRDFFMPGITRCGYHQETLSVACSNCIRDGDGPETILKPTSVCICRSNFHALLSLDTENRVEDLDDQSRGFSRLLDSDVLQGVCITDFARAITVKAKSLGLVKGQIIKWRTAQDLIVSTSVNSSPPSKKKSATIAIALRNALLFEGIPRNPLSTIAFFQTLFGNWSNAEAAISDQIVLREKSTGASNAISISRKRKLSAVDGT